MSKEDIKFAVGAGLTVVAILLIITGFVGLGRTAKERIEQRDRFIQQQIDDRRTCYDNGYTGVKYAGGQGYCYNTMPDEIVSVESLRE